MIKLQNMTPDVYYNQSRDFQFIGRLFDLMLNAAKSNVDLIKELPMSASSDDRLAELMAMTLGLKIRHQYNSKQLKAICAVFSDIMKYKGSIKAIELAYEALLGAEGITQEFRFELPQIDNAANEIVIYTPKNISDLTLFNDLLEYILPAGMRCRIINTTITDTTNTLNFGIGNVSVEAKTANNLGTNSIPRTLSRNALLSDSNAKVRTGLFVIGGVPQHLGGANENE